MVLPRRWRSVTFFAGRPPCYLIIWWRTGRIASREGHQLDNFETFIRGPIRANFNLSVVNRQIINLGILLSARVFSPPHRAKHHWQGKGKGPRQNNTPDSWTRLTDNCLENNNTTSKLKNTAWVPSISSCNLGVFLKMSPSSTGIPFLFRLHPYPISDSLNYVRNGSLAALARNKTMLMRCRYIEGKKEPWKKKCGVWRNNDINKTSCYKAPHIKALMALRHKGIKASIGIKVHKRNNYPLSKSQSAVSINLIIKSWRALNHSCFAIANPR